MNTTNFLIIWTELNQWETVLDYTDGPHEYAWTHPNYKKSPYLFIPIQEEPTVFTLTPEDEMLKSIFT